MSNYDLEEELERIKREFDQKFGNTGMTFDELPDDLEAMLSGYAETPYQTNQNRNTLADSWSQPTQQYQQQYDDDDGYYEDERQQKQQQQQQQEYYDDNDEYYDDNQQYNNNQPDEIPEFDEYDQNEQYGNNRRGYDEQIEIDLDAYLDNEEMEDEQNEFDDALPPLEDMLLLVTNTKIHDAYNYSLPKRVPVFQQPVQYVQPTYQAPVAQAQQPANSGGLPPLDQPAWSVYDCDLLVQHLKKLLMSILQDALTVKKLDLQNPVNTSKSEAIFRSSGNQLKEVREIIAVVARIDTQDSNHTEIQLEVERQANVMIKSTVVMLRTAMNVTKRIATIDQFSDVYSPFFNNAKNLIGQVNNLKFGMWGPNEVFFA